MIDTIGSGIMILYYLSLGGFSPNIAIQYDTLFFQR